MSDLAALTHDDFDPHTGTGFELSADDSRAIRLTLHEVKSRGKTPSAAGGGPARQSFSLLFVASADAPDLPQGVYHLEHASLGALDLFIVPVGPEEGAMRYEAVFT